MQENSKSGRPGVNDLLIRATRNAAPPPGRDDYPRWACVRDLFEVDHETAVQLCREANLNPYEYLNGPVCDVCPGDSIWENA